VQILVFGNLPGLPLLEQPVARIPLRVEDPGSGVLVLLERRVELRHRVILAPDAALAVPRGAVVPSARHESTRSDMVGPHPPAIAAMATAMILSLIFVLLN
jgi:hypothetical protein